MIYLKNKEKSKIKYILYIFNTFLSIEYQTILSIKAAKMQIKFDH